MTFRKKELKIGGRKKWLSYTHYFNPSKEKPCLVLKAKKPRREYFKF